MTEAVPYLAALANAAVLGVIGLMLHSLGRAHRPAVTAPVELRTAALHQVKRDDSIVLNIDDLEMGAACPLPMPVVGVAAPRRHHHHH